MCDFLVCVCSSRSWFAVVVRRVVQDRGRDAVVRESSHGLNDRVRLSPRASSVSNAFIAQFWQSHKQKGGFGLKIIIAIEQPAYYLAVKQELFESNPMIPRTNANTCGSSLEGVPTSKCTHSSASCRVSRPLLPKPFLCLHCPYPESLIGTRHRTKLSTIPVAHRLS